jgi:hypothetical protein
MNNEECAKVFTDAIKKLAEKPENLKNLEFYLGNHFDVWLKEYASTPKALVYEMKHFAEMEI